MPEQDTAVPVTIGLPAEPRDVLDGLARTLRHDRSHLLNEAVAQYVEAQEGWAAHLREGLRQAEAGEIASPEEVAEVLVARPGHRP